MMKFKDARKGVEFAVNLFERIGKGCAAGDNSFSPRPHEERILR
jgi:hypothetical protein